MSLMRTLVSTSLLNLASSRDASRLLKNANSEFDSACMQFAQLYIKDRTFDYTHARCNIQNECEGLRWSDESRKRVITGPFEKNQSVYYPVTCSEAVYELSDMQTPPDGDKPGIAKPVEKKIKHEVSLMEFLDENCNILASRSDNSAKETGRCVNKVCTGISWTDRTKRKIALGSKQGLAVSCYEAVGLVSVSAMKYSSMGSGSVQPIVVKFVRHKDRRDKRVRVLASFRKQGRSTKFSLMFDTGSDTSFMRMQGKEDGYQDRLGIAKEFTSNIVFGAQDGQDVMRIVKRVDETISIDGFSFDVGLGLAETTAADIDAGLLGGARGSPFSRAARTFAYLGGLGWGAGSLLIGPEHDWKSYCRSSASPIFVDVYADASDWLWIVEGSAGLSSSRKRDPVNWILDTGCAGIYVPPSIYEEAVATIAKAGSVVDGGFVSNCFENIALFPTVLLQVGEFTIPLTPTEYATAWPAAPSLCEFHLKSAGLNGLKHTYLIGEPILKKMLTIFKEEEEQMGFCLL